MSGRNRLIDVLAGQEAAPQRNALLDFMVQPSTADVRNTLSNTVTNRATFFPAADYADGSTRWAWPGALYEPVQSFNKLMAGEGGPGDAMNVAGSAMLGALPFAARGALGAAGGKLTQPQGIKAYHGSPYDFDRFSLEHIGKGEGAQAYGHGLYFAESEGVARSYRDTLGKFGFTVGGQPFDDADPMHYAAQVLQQKGSRDAAIKALAPRKSMFSDKLIDDPLTAKARSILESDADIPPYSVDQNGRLYEVSIKADPEDFLDWDKPLSQQSELVKEAFKKVGGERYLDPVDPYPARDALEKIGSERLQPGQPANQMMGAASDALREAGIPGIRYLDQVSRTAGEGTSNYVVFDDNLIEILRKYGLIGAIGAGTAASSQTPDQGRLY